MGGSDMTMEETESEIFALSPFPHENNAILDHSGAQDHLYYRS